MSRLLVWLLVLIGLVLAQNVPYGLGLEQGTRVLVFVAPNCAACETLANLPGLPVLYVGRAESLPYKPYRRDPGDVLARAFRIRTAPTMVVLKDGQEVKRFTSRVDPGVLGLVVRTTESGSMAPRFRQLVKVGQPAPEPYNNFTGLLVFWQEDCMWCQREAESLAKLCASRPVWIVSGQGKWPQACAGEPKPELFSAFGIPGTPAHVYLKEGRVVWLDFGYRSDLEELLGALEAMGVR